eukprot:676945_1
MAQQSGHKRDNMVVLSDDEEASTDSNSAQPSKKRRKLNDGQAHGLTKSTKKQSNNLTQRSIFSSFGLKDPNPPKQQKQSKKHDKKAMRFKANTNTNDTQTVQSVCDSDHPLIPFNPKERKNDVLSHTIDGIAVYKCQKRHTKRQWTNAKYIKTGNEIQYIQSNCFYFTEDKYNSIKKNAGLKGNIYEFMKFEDKMDTTDSDQHAVSSISWHCYACHEYNQSHQSVITTSTLKSIVEGGFSKQNWILGNRRLSMSTDLLRNLMFIIMNGEKWENDERLLEVLSKSIKKFVRSNRTLTSNI